MHYFVLRNDIVLTTSNLCLCPSVNYLRTEVLHLCKVWARSFNGYGNSETDRQTDRQTDRLNLVFIYKDIELL